MKVTVRVISASKASAIRSHVLFHLVAIRLAQLSPQRTRAFGHRVHQFDPALQFLMLGRERGTVAAEQAVEYAARIILRRNGTAIEVIRYRARARKVSGARIDGKHQRRLAAPR
jgi:hypothetical protein